MKFLNVFDTSECYLSEEKRFEMFMDIVSGSLDDMFQLFFETGMQSGIVFSLDMGFLGESSLFDEVVKAEMKGNKSILRQLIFKER